MKKLNPGFFAARLTDSEYPLWGMVIGIVLFGIPIIGFRLRVTKDGGDIGPILLGFVFCLEWGGS